MSNVKNFVNEKTRKIIEDEERTFANLKDFQQQKAAKTNPSPL
ncbi:MAG: hypothetical protein ABGY08_05195 [Gammaproteobacteria bacterium]|jgi:hypothetical protein